MSEFIVICGLSGAGRSTASDVFEDLGWFVIDNLPPALIPKVADLSKESGGATQRMALVVGTGAFLDELGPALNDLRATGARVRVLFLEATDDVLVRRYENTRRRHPVDDDTVIEAIRSERDLLAAIKEQADLVVDTSDLNVHQLRHRLVGLYGREDHDIAMRTVVQSFGYKHGVPLDVDLLFDCRFLPNPHWVPDLRAFSGLDAPVRDYVMGQPESVPFLDKIGDLLRLVLPAYVKEGKAYLTIGVGCTGGRHRSVVMAEEIANIITAAGYRPSVEHRDVGRGYPT
jgi:UPF0042 nucleotide-binding protein